MPLARFNRITAALVKAGRTRKLAPSRLTKNLDPGRGREARGCRASNCSLSGGAAPHRVRPHPRLNLLQAGDEQGKRVPILVAPSAKN